MRRFAWGGMVPLLFLLPTLGYALTLGNISVRSALNEPFEADIQLSPASGDDLEKVRIRVAPNADFVRAGLDRLTVLNDLRFKVRQGRGGKRTVQVSSVTPMRDPILEFLVEVLSPQGRMVRQYTVLLDPPELPADFRSSSPVAAPRVAPRSSGTIRRVRARKPAAVHRPAVVRSSSGGGAGKDVYGPTRRNETAWDIAKKVRPGSSVSMNQMMMALLRANPQGFANNNINNLKSGVMLRIPEQDEITSLSRAQASNDFQRQYREWKAGIASAPPPKVERQVVSEKVRADVAKVKLPPPATESGELVLVSPPPEDAKQDSGVGAADAAGSLDQGIAGGMGGATGESNDDLRRQRDLAQEQAHTVAQEARELRSRTDELEQRVVRMEEALRLRDADIAALQQRLGQTAAAPPESLEQGSASEARPGEQAQALVEPDSLSGDAQVLDAESSVVSMLEENWQLLAGALGLLGLGAAGIYLARRRSEDEVDGVAELEEAPAVDMPKVVAGDVLTEVNQYLVLGRPQQAEERLKQEMARQPERLELSLKLLEVYSRTGNKEAFDALAAEVFSRIGRDAGRPDWQRIAGMGRRLSPNNPLYASKTVAPAGYVPPAAAAPSPSRAAPVSVSPATIAAGVGAVPPQPKPPAPTVAKLEDEGSAFDELEQELRRLEEEIGATVAAESTVPAAAQDAEPPAASDDLDGMDFDLSFDDFEAVDKVDAGVASAADTESIDGSLEFDWGAGGGAPADEEVTLDLPDVSEPDSGSGGVDSGVEIGLAFDTDSYDLGEATVTHGGLGESAGFAAETGGKEVFESDLLTEGQAAMGGDLEELTTKLDLARAYVDMDDKPSAIDILEEVLKEADGSLRDEAEALRKQLG